MRLCGAGGECGCDTIELGVTGGNCVFCRLSSDRRWGRGEWWAHTVELGGEADFVEHSEVAACRHFLAELLVGFDARQLFRLLEAFF